MSSFAPNSTGLPAFLLTMGRTNQVFYHPREEYTKRLIASRPTRRKLKGEVRP